MTDSGPGFALEVLHEGGCPCFTVIGDRLHAFGFFPADEEGMCSLLHPSEVERVSAHIALLESAREYHG